MNGTSLTLPAMFRLVSHIVPIVVTITGNNSPSNGTTVVCDEMISDLVPAEPTERMEFWKTVGTRLTVPCSLPSSHTCAL